VFAAGSGAALTHPVATPAPAATLVEGKPEPVMRPQHVRERLEPTLLLVSQALIERTAGIGELFERRAYFGEMVRAPRQPVEPIVLALALLPRTISLHASLHPRNAQLRKLAQRLLEWRPVFLLVGSEFESGFERGDARIGERVHIGDARPMMLGAGSPVSKAVVLAKTLLGIYNRRAGNGENGCRGDYRLEHVILQRCRYATNKDTAAPPLKLNFGHLKWSAIKAL
jgi:hypothetical protein